MLTYSSALDSDRAMDITLTATLIRTAITGRTTATTGLTIGKELLLREKCWFYFFELGDPPGLLAG